MANFFTWLSCVMLLGLCALPDPTYAATSPVLSHGSRNYPQVALTFDADMTPGMLTSLQSGKVSSWYNQSIINLLDQTHTKATIFLTGLWAQTYPQAARQIAHDPLFEIGNHSWKHFAFTADCYTLPALSPSEYAADITHAQHQITAITGIQPKYFRFPGGCFNAQSLAAVQSQGLQVVQWDVVSSDAFNNDPASIIRAVETQTKNGSIIVMHLHGGPNAPATATALPQIITDLSKRHYQFVKLSELRLPSCIKKPCD